MRGWWSNQTPGSQSPTSWTEIQINYIFISPVWFLTCAHFLSEFEWKIKRFLFPQWQHPLYHPLFYRDILVPYNVSTGYLIYNIWVGGNLKIVNQPAAGENLPSVISETPTQYCESWFQSWVISTQFVICHRIWTLKRKKWKHKTDPTLGMN